jgi:hypothetical protein
MRRFTLWLSPAVVESLREVARWQSVEQRKDLSWADVVREALKKLVAARKAKETI